MTCRYCFRKNELATPDHLFQGKLTEAVQYLKESPEVEEVILSGGDPLIIDDHKLENIFHEFSKVSTVKYLRIHTRTPIILPSRMTDSLIKLLKRYSKIFSKLALSIHINHSDEIDDQVASALRPLQNSGLELLSQSVLLKDINDDVQTLVSLFKNISKLGLRPYYLHHPDQVKGAMHFCLSLTEGRMLYHALRDYLPGWLIPHYIVESPEGGGKLPAFNPETFNYSGELLTRESDPLKN